MTLTEIETILQQLATRHPNLDTVLLTTLLSSAGWEEKTIKEAVVLFAQRKPAIQNLVVSTQKNIVTVVQQPTTSVVDSVKKEEPLTFLQPDGSEEGVLPVFSNETIKRNEPPKIEKKNIDEQTKGKMVIKKEEPEPQKEVVEEIKPVVVTLEKEQLAPVVVPVVEVIKVEPVVEQVIATPQVKEKEPESLIVHEEIPVRRTHEKDVEIPSNLPLLPFESSPHIWSFSKYKDMFHKDALHKEEIQLITVMPREEKSTVTAPVKGLQEVSVNTPQVQDKEVSLEKIPMTKGDESLVFLAGMMLFAIILILGYMYSNGRL
jgi:hypothetical protein